MRLFIEAEPANPMQPKIRKVQYSIYHFKSRCLDPWYIKTSWNCGNCMVFPDGFQIEEIYFQHI